MYCNFFTVVSECKEKRGLTHPSKVVENMQYLYERCLVFWCVVVIGSGGECVYQVSQEVYNGTPTTPPVTRVWPRVCGQQAPRCQQRVHYFCNLKTMFWINYLTNIIV